MPPTAPTARGYRGFDWPSPALAWALLTEPRFGLFAYSPFLVLAFAAPFVTRLPWRLPERESRLLLLYFALFLVFCSANQYSWLQPLTGFRYLVPVVPGLALLAVQASQGFSRPVKCLLAGLSCSQTMLLAWTHQNDVRRTLSTLRETQFEPLWLIRLQQADAPAVWIRAAIGFAALASIASVLEISKLLLAAAKSPAEQSH